MNTRLSHVLIGLFVVVLASALVLVGLWLSAGLSSAEWAHYSVYTDNSVGGLRADAPVTFSGVEVGRVQSLQLVASQPGRVHIVLAVRPDAPVRADTRATVAQQGLTGITFVELKGGSPDQPPQAPPGEPYPVLESTPSRLDTLADSATTSLASLQQVLEDVQTLLGPDNRQALTATLDHLEGLTRQLQSSLAAVDALMAQGSGAVEDSRRLLRRLERLAAGADAAVADLPQLLESANATLAQVRASADAVTAAARQGSAAGEAGQQGLQRINRSTLPRLEAVLADLGRASRRLDSLLISLQQDPSQLIRGRAPVPPGPGEATR